MGQTTHGLTRVDPHAWPMLASRLTLDVSFGVRMGRSCGSDSAAIRRAIRKGVACST
jgi:hypothetical protein